MAGENRKLYVNRIASTVDEYTILQLFSKYGKITSLDYIFHTSGPLKGKPKGYAFVEMSSVEEAMKTMSELNDKLVRGQRIQVSLSKSTVDRSSTDRQVSGPTSASRRPAIDKSRQTMLSKLKSVHSKDSTEAKIKALEDKLKGMTDKSDNEESQILKKSSKVDE